jgi:cyclic-di-AMP phosphodiesterase PgpH
MPSQNGTLHGVSIRHLGRSLADFFAGRFSSGPGERRARLVLLLLSALSLMFLVNPRQHFLNVAYKAGDIASSGVKATQDYLLEDAPLTEKKRKEAERSAPLVYILDTAAPTELMRRLEQAADLAREAKGADEPARRADLRKQLAQLVGQDPTPEELSILARYRGDRDLEGAAGKAVALLFTHPVVQERNLFSADSFWGIEVINAVTGDRSKITTNESVRDLAEAGGLLARTHLERVDRKDAESLKRLLLRLLQPTLVPDREATEKRKRDLLDSVSPVLFQVKRGEMIVREGDRVTADQAQKLRLMYGTGDGLGRWFTSAGIFGLTLVMFYFPYRFARKNIRKFNPSNRDLLLLSYVTIGYFLLMKIGLVISTALGGTIPYIRTADYYYIFPFAAGAMLVRIVLNSEVALVYCAVCSLLVGVMFENSLFMAIYALLGGIVGAHGVRHCKDRGTIYVAGMKVSVVSLALALSFQLLSGTFFTIETLFCGVLALASGFVTAAIVTATIPVMEALFQYTTDIKLLELANLNAPVLRELMIKAPGTYHHSVLVGNMVEAAAEAISANPLLARVAAYYHDIGKISKPLYFIENVGSSENRHDRLAPSMSALILISHVKEGVELAKENRLGQPIIDIIKQSHGTSLITFFYDKAKKTAHPEVHGVDERDFRYPGPKPQTREAGLVLLADCVEAASRTLADPTPARIQGLVQKIINNIFIDGQLDECELTLKNLHEIAKSFIRVLSGIHHHRIDYPEPAYKEKVSGGKKPLEDYGREQAKAAADTLDAPKKSGGEDLKRLGITH